MIVADTGALIALFDRSDRHHDDLRRIYEENPDAWVPPWAILPEVDYLARRTWGRRPRTSGSPTCPHQLYQADLAALLGISGAAVTHYETGKRRIDTDLADEYARRLNNEISREELVFAHMSLGETAA